MKPLKNYAGASAPAKVILLGEHFVVYNKPAILASIDKRVHVNVRVRKDDRIVIKSDIDSIGSIDQKKRRQIRVKPKWLMRSMLIAATDAMKSFNASVGLDISIRSEFPYGVGLGSSAACSVATIAAVGSLFGKLTKKRICDISLNAEKLVHGDPSGADSAICTYGGLMFFNKNNGVKLIKSKLDLQLFVVNSGIKRATGKLVSVVKEKVERDPDLFMGFASMSESITMQGLEAIKGQDYGELGALMTLNHSLLRKLGVSRTILDRLVEVALKNEALGAKITGAGGGGCIIALTNKHSKNKIMKAMKRYGVFLSKVEHNGVLVE